MSASHSDSLSPAILRTVKRATTQAHPPNARRDERLTPPCHACKYPLLKGEPVCDRCGVEVPA